MGTIVCINSNFEEYVVVDGQQRLTTVSLLLLALHKYLKQKADKTQAENMLTEELLDFLINKHSLDQAKRIRLKPNKQDKDCFEKLFGDQDMGTMDSNILQNYTYFYHKIQNQELNSEQLFNVFKKLEIVLINLDRGIDDPQLIFESLNSTGVDLTDGDLIRNYILMDLDPALQEKLYLKYWVEIERNVVDTAEFIRNLLIYKLGKNVTKTKRAVYNEFKKYNEDVHNRDSEKVLNECLKYSTVYSNFIRIKNHSSQPIDKALDKFYNLEFSVAWPFLFEVFDLYANDIITEKEVVSIVKLIESYAFRKILVDNTTQGLNKLFLTLTKEIKKIDPSNWQNQFIEILKFILQSKRGSQKFPEDKDFIEALYYKEIYSLRSKNRKFLLENLENHNSSYRVDLEDLTIEHILPQNANKWKLFLGDNWQQIRDRYVHTLGNLTLTANNSKLSNKDFQTKQDIDYHTSKLKLSYNLGEETQWGEQQILDRSKKLANEAVEIWPYPKTEYARPVEEQEIYSLSEDIDFTGKKPKLIVFDGRDTTIKYWRDILKVVCDELYKYFPTEFNKIMQYSELKKYFSVGSIQDLRSPVLFNNDKYVEGNQSAGSIISFCKKLCKFLDFDQDNIEIEIVN